MKVKNPLKTDKQIETLIGNFYFYTKSTRQSTNFL